MSLSNKILVAGANGTNGRELLKQLQDNEISVRALVRNKNAFQGTMSDTLELVEGDLSQVETLDSAFKNIQTAYIVTAIHPDMASHYVNFFEAAKRNGVCNIIKLSALGADIHSPSEILRQHARSDQHLIDSGLNYAILRPNSFYQNLIWETRQIRRKGMFSLPLADAQQSLVDVRDIAEATVNLYKNKELENKIYNLTGAESLSFYDVASQLSQAVEKPIKYVEISSEVSVQRMKMTGVPDWNACALTDLQKIFASGFFADIYGDLKKILAREPRRFSDFASDYATQF